jgi:hypothetical protein
VAKRTIEGFLACHYYQERTFIVLLRITEICACVRASLSGSINIFVSLFTISPSWQGG